MPINQFPGLRKIRRLVESYQRPADEFDPNGSWTHQYDIYMIAYAGFYPQGSIRISRTPNRKGAQLDILTVRPTTEPNLQHFTQATLECADNLLVSPRHWTVSSKIAASKSAEPYFDSGMTKEMAFENGRVTITADDLTVDRTVEVGDLYGCRLGMLDAVQRLPAEDGFVIPQFSSFDEYDQIRSGYQLKFRETAPIQLKGEQANLSGFTMTGTGQLPASYWRDETGRLLFFVSGLEVFVLSQENGRKVDFFNKPNVFKLSAQLAKGGKR
ncbi:hypothetical protein [Tichowtungia aerotolerans]|uniref:Uncharacterized protein n=1 Tax=Tichowtungia aerotolerans TaxID=2697043 RepID=A0A6P1MFE8_9BACT|nr:hypothetical protein [Tichowtungia aerotolerans]QHI69795.1 hypothetical protein GT409_10150 [Tichowtungia aerotolerans]